MARHRWANGCRASGRTRSRRRCSEYHCHSRRCTAIAPGPARSAAGSPALRRTPARFIWGLLEARLQQADLVVLGGLNEGTWPAAPSPDPWLAPKIRANLGLPGLEFRTGLSAHDFASALGAPHVLITRARRDERSPTVASRFWLRLQAMTGGVTRDRTARATCFRAGRRRRCAAEQPSGSAAARGRPTAAHLGYLSRSPQSRSVRLLCSGDTQAAQP